MSTQQPNELLAQMMTMKNAGVKDPTQILPQVFSQLGNSSPSDINSMMSMINQMKAQKEQSEQKKDSLSPELQKEIISSCKALSGACNAINNYYQLLAASIMQSHQNPIPTSPQGNGAVPVNLRQGNLRQYQTSPENEEH